MYLTRMHLNPARRQTRLLLASPQRMHAAVLCSFPPMQSSAEDAGRVLWRVDETRSSHTIALWVSSPARPDLTHLVEQAGWPTANDPWQTQSLVPLLDRLQKGQEWVFRLTANPVRSVRPEGGGRGKRYGHVTVEQQEGWLRDRSAGAGFEVLLAGVTGRRQVSFTRRSDGAERSVTFRQATFDGVLRVDDPTLLRDSLVSGIGRAKGYGCGLLTLAPPRSS